MESYVPLLQGLVVAVGAVLAAVLAAFLGVRGYRQQKKQDREEELIKRRQTEYERYLTAFGNAGRWKGVDSDKHTEAEAEYHEAHSNLLLVGADEVIQAANEFHRYYVDTRPMDPKEMKLRYAKMVMAMRGDGFEKTSLSAKEVAMNIPWTVGDENVNPIYWGDQ